MNRAQFEATLQSIYYPQVFTDPFASFEAIYTNNQTKMYDILTLYLRAQGRIAFYLSEWDAAPDQPAKDAVAGSVTGDLGSASVDPASAIMWPDSGGVFGDVKGPASSTDDGISVFDGTSGKVVKEQGSTTGLVIFTAPVDGKIVGNTLLGSVPAGKTFIPIQASFTLLNVAGLALVSTASIGSNSPNYNNILGATLLTGLSTQGEVIGMDLGNPSSVGASTDIYARVSIGSTATTYDLQASVIGFFI